MHIITSSCLVLFLMTACLILGCEDTTSEENMGVGGAEGGAQSSRGGEEQGGATQGGVTQGGATQGGATQGGATQGGMESAGDESSWDMEVVAMGGDSMSGGAQIEFPEVCGTPPAPPPQSPIEMGPRCRQNGEPLKIRHIRDDRCPDYIDAPTRQPGVEVTLEGLVVTGVFDDKFSVQDVDGGIYSGLWVYDSSRQTLNELTVGMMVTLHGQLIEFYTLTELVVNAGDVEVIGQAPVPEAIFVSDSAQIADGGAWVEPLESVLVEVHMAMVTDTAPDCPRDFGMFVVNQNLRIAQEAEFDYTPSRGDLIERLVGVLHFSFDHQKVLPRGDQDLSVILCGGTPDKCEASECSVLPDAQESGRLIITEIQNNPSGEDDLREFVELYNPNSTSIDLRGWTVQDCGGRTAPLSGRVDERSYWVIAQSLDQNQNGGVRAQGEMGELFLPNGYGSVLLFDSDGTLVDQVRYAPGDEGWPSRASGESLELIEPASNNSFGDSWAAGRDRYGDGGRGTPGAPYR